MLRFEGMLVKATLFLLSVSELLPQEPLPLYQNCLRYSVVYLSDFQQDNQLQRFVSFTLVTNMAIYFMINNFIDSISLFPSLGRL